MVYSLSLEQFNRSLDHLFSSEDFSKIYQHFQFKSPKIGKIWQDKNLDSGLYIIISGKVRLVNEKDELIANLGVGDTFGEFTLFPETDFYSYEVRAGVKVELCFIPVHVLSTLINQYPTIHNHLFTKALEINSFLTKIVVEYSPGIEHKLPTLSPSEIKPPDDIKISEAYMPTPSQRSGHLLQRIFRRYPFYAQQSASDCGAACLVMVSRYWSKRFNINYLRDIVNISLNGTSLRSLSHGAERVGFSTRPVKASLNQLSKQKLPAIAHWEGKHYIVVYEITNKHVIVADPAIGQLTLSHSEFKEKWTGYTLLLEPTAFLKDTSETVTPFWQFFQLAKPHGRVMLEIFIASIFIQIFGLITPFFTQIILDEVVYQRSELTLVTFGSGLLIFSVSRVLMIGLRRYLLDHTAQKIDLALIVGFIRHTLSLPLSFFESKYVGDIISRVEETSKIQRFLSGEASSIILDFMTVFIYLLLMFFYNWKMALLVLVIVPPFFLIALIGTPFFRKISRQIFNAHNKESSYLIEAISGVSTIKSNAVEQTVRWHWEDLLNKRVKSSFSGQVLSNLLQIFSNLIDGLMSTSLLWFGAYLVIKNELKIGQLVAFNMLLANVITPFQRLIFLWNELQEVTIAIERVNDILDVKPEEDLEHQTLQPLPPLQGHIRFCNVTFRYHPESDINILENLSFVIYPGQKVALVGRSGSGKTTISKLILGLYPPTKGKILIDGYDISNLINSSLREQVGIVDQDTFLFGGTIAENISLGKPSASFSQIVEAAQLGGADEFIRKLPMGYESQIGEGGGMLSGGQRQRIAIARALLGNPTLLILDEATSHLDAESEQIIQKNLNTILKNRTTLIIAHRLSTIRNADLILVIDKGILVESGTHQQLMEKCGHYYYLNQQQLNQGE
jgi:subfamily B ATP-binding cassette protein HlyB/CyaB